MFVNLKSKTDLKIKLISYLFVVQVGLIVYISTNLLNFGCSLHKAVY